MKPSKSSVFGSSLHVPNVPDQSLRPLTRRSEQEVLKKLSPILDTITKRFENGTDNPFSLNTFYVSQGPRASDESLEKLILANVFADKRLDSFPIYTLSKESIMTETYDLEHRYAYVQNVFNRVKNTLRPCILYIPRIDAIMTECSTIADTIIVQTHLLQEKPILVLATSAQPMSHQVRQRLKGAMKNEERFCIDVGPPNAKERGDYLNDVFFEAATFTNQSGRSQGKLKDEDVKQMTLLKTLAVNNTEGNSIQEISKLQDTLLQTCARHFGTQNKSKLFNELTSDILKHSHRGQ